METAVAGNEGLIVTLLGTINDHEQLEKIRSELDEEGREELEVALAEHRPDLAQSHHYAPTPSHSTETTSSEVTSPEEGWTEGELALLFVMQQFKARFPHVQDLWKDAVGANDESPKTLCAPASQDNTLPREGLDHIREAMLHVLAPETVAGTGLASHRWPDTKLSIATVLSK